jgi:DNA segregation ATPase FtsK/SpoIIIE, S-DNA-T family
LLRRMTEYLQSAAQPGQRPGDAAGQVAEMPGLALMLIDPSRGLIDLAEGPAIEGYAASAAAAENLVARLTSELQPRVPPDGASVSELRGGRWWSGPQYVLIVDDYDLLVGSMGGPFAPLAELVAQSADIGLSVVITRRVAGSQRTSFEPFAQRLREVADHALILSGQPDEGPLVGGVTARPRPPGRGILVSGRARPQLVQCCLLENPPAGAAAAWFETGVAARTSR